MRNKNCRADVPRPGPPVPLREVNDDGDVVEEYEE